MKLFAKSVAVASIFAAANVGSAHADLLASATNNGQQEFRREGKELPVRLRSSGATSLKFQTRKSKVVLLFNANCGVGSAIADQPQFIMRIYVDGARAQPSDRDLEFCSPHVGKVRASFQAIFTGVKAGTHTAEVRVLLRNRGLNGYGLIDNSSFTISD